jgi:hypothetical protein
VIKIENPLWRPDDAILRRLNIAVSQEIRAGKSDEFTAQERRQVSKVLAMQAVMAMLARISHRVSS